MQEEWISQVVSSQIRPQRNSSISFQHEGKTVYFIRHGESEANVCNNMNEKQINPKYRDTKLTEEGINQARNLQQIVSNWEIELVIISPLSRTIQTFCNAFENHPKIDQIQLTIAPIVTEFFCHYQECQGRNKEEILNDESLKSLKLFNKLQSSINLLPENWWEIADKEERLSHFSHFLHHVKATKICIVSHWGFIHRIFSSNPGIKENYSPKNCEWIYSIWKRIGDSYKHLEINENQYENLFHYLIYLNSHYKEYSDQMIKIITKNKFLHQEKLKFFPNRKYSLCILPGGNRKRNGLLNEIMDLQFSLSSSDFNSKLNFENFWFFIPLSKFLCFSSEEKLFDFYSCLYQIRNDIVQNKNIWRVSTPNISLITNRNPTNGNINFISFAFDSLTIRTNILDTLLNEFSYLSYNDFYDIFSCTICNISNCPEAENFLMEKIRNSLPCLDGALFSNVDYGWDYLFKRVTWRLVLCSTDANGSDFSLEPVSLPLW